MSTIKGVDTVEQLRQFCPGVQIPGEAAPARPSPSLASDRAEKHEMVTPAVVLNNGVLVALMPVETKSESNQREWRNRSKRSNAAWRAVSKTFGPGLHKLAQFAFAYHLGKSLKITFTRLGGRKLDRGNIASALKGTEDACAYMIGADDGDERWDAHYEQSPGGPVGVRVTIEVAT